MIARLLEGLTYDEYEALQGERSSTLKAMSISAKHYRHRLANKTETGSLKLGKAAHCAVLEPSRFLSDHAVWIERSKDGKKAAPRNGGRWDSFVEEHHGKTLLTLKEYFHAVRIRESIVSDATAMKYLESGAPEVSMQFPLLGRQCKARVDWLTKYQSRATIVGLKSARDVREFLFGSQAARLHYHIQWAYYFDGYAAITGEAPRMIEISVENAPPYDVVVYNIPNEIVVAGREKYTELLHALDECERFNSWPGIGNGAELDLSFPSWAYTQPLDDDLSALGLVADSE